MTIIALKQFLETVTSNFCKWSKIFLQ